MKYVALIRGINVGGKNIISMKDLKLCFETAGYEHVSTYINSGNVFFVSNETDTASLARSIEEIIDAQFGASIGVTVLSETKLQLILESSPKWWGNDTEMKHNLIFMLEPYDMRAVSAAIGEIKPEIERMEVGDGVVYQSLSLKDFGKTMGGKLAANNIYKQMTVRNYNTSLKLLDLLKAL